MTKFQVPIIFVTGLAIVASIGFFIHSSDSRRQQDRNEFSKVTGDDTRSTGEHWDQVFRGRQKTAMRPPTPFLVENLPQLKRGKALVLAMGSGRNALYLAENGFDVDGVDISRVAVRRAKKEASRRNVRINAVQADFRHYPFPENTYDLIVCVSYFNIEVVEKVYSPFFSTSSLRLFLLFIGFTLLYPKPS